MVRRIYSMFMHGKTTCTIARQLTSEGIPTPAGKSKWQASTVNSILTNEKYKGAALLQKKFTVDFLTKTMKKNEGEVPQYFIEHSHPAIIDPLEFNLVQNEIARRKTLGRKYSGGSVFSCRIVCGDCGEYFGSKVWHSNSKFQNVPHTPFQRRLAKLYKRKDDVPMIFQNETHKRFFEAERTKLCKPSNQALAALYLLTADHTLWIRTKRHIASSGKVELESVRLGDISTDGYALWKAVKELQTGERQISLCELSDGAVISDRVFRLIVQAVAIARFGAAVLNGSEVRHD